MSKFNTEHYEAIAAVIKQERIDTQNMLVDMGIIKIAAGLSRYFRQIDPDFDSKKFALDCLKTTEH